MQTDTPKHKDRGLYRYDNSKELLEDLIQGYRIEESFLKSLNKKLFFEISESYHSRLVSKLIAAIGLL